LTPKGGILKSILLIQEDPSRLIALAMVLRSQGWSILETDNRTQAINACLEHSGAIELLLIDFELSCHHGPEVAMRLLELSPEMQVVIVLNSPPESLLDTGLLPGGCAVLSKPFSADSLIAAVEDLLKPPRTPRAIQRKPDHREKAPHRAIHSSGRS
jgi:two-component system cell cycle sensor histidine kinase/response regulator CckA